MNSLAQKAYLMELVLALAPTTFIKKANIISATSKETSIAHVMICPRISLALAPNHICS
jgi:hypothetical protein